MTYFLRYFGFCRNSTKPKVSPFQNIQVRVPIVQLVFTLQIIVGRFIYLTDLYQEQPHLLDRILEELLTRLLDLVRLEEKELVFGLKAKLAFKFLHHLAKVRGPKTVIQKLPHQVGDFELVLRSEPHFLYCHC